MKTETKRLIALVFISLMFIALVLKVKKTMDIHSVTNLEIYTAENIYYANFKRLEVSTEKDTMIFKFKNLKELAEFISSQTANDVKN